MPPCRVQRRADRNARQGQTVGVCRGTIFRGTQAQILNRKSRVSSGEEPSGQSEIDSLYQRTADRRLVQRAIREDQPEHTPPHAAEK